MTAWPLLVRWAQIFVVLNGLWLVAYIVIWHFTKVDRDIQRARRRIRRRRRHEAKLSVRGGAVR